MDWTWMAEEDELTAVALTVRAQTIDPTDQGRLLWDQFLPRRDVDTTELESFTTMDWRFAADRREWNTRGRLINPRTPPRRKIEWVPIESYFTMEEREINKLLNNVRGNMALFREMIGASIPGRTDMLVMANWRRLEIDVFNAWINGQIIVRNPQTGQTYTTSYGFDANRYQTAGTAWDDGGVNAYNELIAWLDDAYEAIGPMEGVMLRHATRDAIVADTPNPMAGAISGLVPSITQTELRIQDAIGRPFRFFPNENSLDVYDDAGVAVTRTKVFPAQKVAAVPAGFSVGSTAFAPVNRAYDLSNQVPDAGVDIRGVTVFHEAANGGRELTVEAQFNPFPDPDEQKCYVIDAGV